MFKKRINHTIKTKEDGRYFFLICLLPDFVYYIFVFSIINDEFWLWGGSGKSTDTRRYDIAMQYYIFFFLLLLFFFLRLLLQLKFKPLLRCAYVRYFHFFPENLVAKTEQFVSLFGRL